MATVEGRPAAAPIVPGRIPHNSWAGFEGNVDVSSTSGLRTYVSSPTANRPGDRVDRIGAWDRGLEGQGKRKEYLCIYILNNKRKCAFTKR
jgi:hypothetical protein